MTLTLLLLTLVTGPALACQMHDGLPDPVCTPGAIDPRITQQNIARTICVPGYSQSVRPPLAVTRRLKRERMAAYGLTGSPSAYELDHAIPLALGGCPDCLANLWPEPWSGPHNAHDKDRVENELHRLVCSGRMSLAEAQRRIAADWLHALNDQGEDGP